MKKKLYDFFAILVAGLLVFSFFSCGSDAGDDGGSGNGNEAKSLRIVFNANGGTINISEQTVTQEKQEEKLKTAKELGLSYEHHTFLGWARTADIAYNQIFEDGSPIHYSGEYLIVTYHTTGVRIQASETITLYAVWSETQSEIDICAILKSLGANSTATAFKPSSQAPAAGKTTFVINDVWNAVVWLDGTTIYYYADGLTDQGKTIPLGEKQANGMFAGCKSLEVIDMSGFDTKNVTTMSGMFQGCTALSNLDISNFDTSKVTNMSSMFLNCSSLASLDVSTFDTSNVSGMRNMFSRCNSLTSLDLSKFDTSKVTDMESMFEKCSSLVSLNVSSFDTSNVADMVKMFEECSSITSLDLSKFNTSKVTDMESMFEKCSSLVSLNVTSFDTSKVVYMDAMFAGCSSLQNLNLRNFNTSAAGTKGKRNWSYGMNDMFNGCSSLTSLDVSSFDTSNVTELGRIFKGCSSLTTIDISSFKLNENEPTIMTWGMFDDCTNLTTIYAANDANWTKAYDGGLGMFENCNALVGGNGTAYATEGTGKKTSDYARVDGINGKKGYLTAKSGS